MKNEERFQISLCFFVALVGVCSVRPAVAQNQELQQKIAEVKEAAAQNKQALAQYTWVEQDSIILKGEQKKQEHFQVRLGPDGKPMKTPLDAQASSSAEGGRKHGLKHHVVEKKKEEYKEYADQMKTLLQQYVPPQKELLAQAAQQGNIALAPQAPAMAAGTSGGEVRLVISNYAKPGDKMILIMDRTTRQIRSLNVASYLSDPKDAVNMNVEFAAIPGGPNHVSGATINGVSKQLTITVQNSNYQKL
jgi:hypothetical protein